MWFRAKDGRLLDLVVGADYGSTDKSNFALCLYDVSIGKWTHLESFETEEEAEQEFEKIKVKLMSGE